MDKIIITVVAIVLMIVFICQRISLIRKSKQQKDTLEVLQQNLIKFEKLISQNERGVYKRIDENRELLELLIRETPDLFESHGWIRGWFKSLDEYLLALSYEATLSEEESGIRVRPYPNVPGDTTPHKD
ncbi:hypothetical protein M2J86_25025 (plasmid) [Citrobacter freundii]|uniref:Uncharacterized protein n=5 Tax=Enterobacterales TaxID=91347 RepID=A0ABD5C430_ECOLX|nr:MULTISPECIES: hypothetical protein [Enterobacterales]AGT26772.1 hypothetical protein N559_5198 [Klebsiella pneumoniae JM45]HDL8517167.1 hypothetical protein [Yersinia enterocolitica]ALK43892.1 hypothetical protein [Enterobacter cloacae]ASK03911.1 hypothetical protein CFA70_28625 [Citrobacter freundii]AVA18252.1 Hypothetical protein [Citrobacter freundii]